MVQQAIAILIGVFILAIIAFALLPEIMNQGEEAKANSNVTGTQGLFIDLVGLFIIIAVALAAFAVSFTSIKGRGKAGF